MIQKKVTDFFALEGNYPDLDGEGAAARLSAAIRCKTINYFDHSRTDYTEFDKLHAHIKASYPNIMRVGTFERIGHHAVLITIPGSDASLRPCLYMSHQDVVPVVEGTEQDWTHPAFSGDIADGYIWGRGTLDIKEQVFGVLDIDSPSLNRFTEEDADGLTAFVAALTRSVDFAHGLLK